MHDLRKNSQLRNFGSVVDPDPYSGASWIWIQIGPKSWIRIQIQCFWIHNIGLKYLFLSEFGKHNIISMLQPCNGTF